MPSYCNKTLIACLVALTLASCGTPPKLVVSGNERFRLLSEQTPEVSSVRVVDDRPDEQRLLARFGGFVQLGDGLLSPSPPEAIARVLEAHVASSSTSDGVRRALRGGVVELKHFQVLAVNKEIENEYLGREAQTIPGVLILGSLITALQTATVGSSRIRVIISFDLGDYRFNTDETMTFTASPGDDAPAAVLSKAMKPVYRRLEIAFTSASPK